MKEFYTTLGVEGDATLKEIKKAYRALSKKHHPDAGGNEEEFKKISEAYETLSDPLKKKAYDSGEAYVKEGDTEKQARRNLINCFMSAVQSGLTAGGHENPFHLIGEKIRDGKRELKQRIEHEKENIKRLEALMRAITPEGSLFHSCLEDEKGNSEVNIMGHKREMIINDKMGEILKEGDFKWSRLKEEYMLEKEDQMLLGGMGAW